MKYSIWITFGQRWKTLPVRNLNQQPQTTAATTHIALPHVDGQSVGQVWQILELVVPQIQPPERSEDAERRALIEAETAWRSKGLTSFA